MADSPGGPRDLTALVHEREEHWSHLYSTYSIIDNAIRGVLPTSLAQELFADGEMKIDIRSIQNAAFNLTRLASKVFPIAVDKLGRKDSDASDKAAERVEKIAYGWYNGSALRRGPEIDALMFQFARDQVRFFDGCLLVRPDYDRKLVYFDRIDPRMHLPPVGWTPWQMNALNNTVIVKEMTLGEVKAMYGDTDKTIVMRLENEFNAKVSTRSGGWVTDDTQKVKVTHFRSRERWYVSALGKTNSITLFEASEGDPMFPGVTGVVSFQNFETEPLFMGQVGIEAALQKIINQEIQGAQQMLTGPIFGGDVVGEIDWNGYNVMRDNGVRPPMAPQRMAPNSPMNLERVFGSLMGLQSLFNYNPPSMSGTGEANSGKALKELAAGPHSIVQDILWVPFKNGWPRAFDDAAEMEMNCWPNERKKAIGTKGKTPFEIDYTPITALRDYLGRIKIESGFGLGGYQQTLDGMQRVQMGGMSMQTFMEMTPDIRDVGGEMRKIEAEQLSKFADAAFEAAAAQDPKSALRALAEIKTRVDGGMAKFDAIQEVIQAGLLDPPQPDPAAAGGVPPELAALMGGAPPEMAPPSLTEARGF